MCLYDTPEAICLGFAVCSLLFSLRHASHISQVTTWKEISVYRLSSELLALKCFLPLYFFLILVFLATYFITNSFIPFLALSHPSELMLGTALSSSLL